MGNRHYLAKIFRRGKGISDLEFSEIRCVYQKGTLELFAYARLANHYHDPRLSREQRARLIREVFDDSVVECQISKLANSHVNKDASNMFNKVLVVPKFMKKNYRYLTPEAVTLMFNATQDFNEKAFRNEAPEAILRSYCEALLWLFDSKKLTREEYWINFNRLSNDLDLSQNSENTLKKVIDLDGTSVKDVLLMILENKYVTAEDIEKICYGEGKSMRRVALEHKLSANNNKLVVALMDGNV